MVPDFSVTQKKLTLNYFLVSMENMRTKVSLNLFEAEIYQAAVIAQQLVGNLVYYSNHGRYEPQIAESWQRVNPNEWQFKLKENFQCENGEKITPTSFKESIERTIRTLSTNNEVPIFNKLVGYSDFIAGEKNISGIAVDQYNLIFIFTEPLKSGLIQMLSFAPFGYICKENLNEEGKWKDDNKFISSGPYRVKEIEIGKKYVLEKRKNWPKISKKSPETVIITPSINATALSEKYGIIDTFSSIENIPPNYTQFHIVPEYLNAVVLGKLKNGFFANIDRRKFLRNNIQKNRHVVPSKWKSHQQSATFYSTQEQPTTQRLAEINEDIKAPEKPLVIEGTDPLPGSSRWFVWQILKSTLDNLKWPYKFANNQSTWAKVTSPEYDIRIKHPSIGGGVEAWGLEVLFCSQLGANFPDPTNRICNMLKTYEKDQLDDTTLANSFFEFIENDAAIIPISHHGLNWYLSPGIEQDSLSPLVSVIRFEDLELE